MNFDSGLAILTMLLMACQLYESVQRIMAKK